MADHIPYIHNYCDRWCERCTMTSRCVIYVPNQTGQSEETTEEENENLWKSVAENLAIATKLITEEIERRGIVFSEEDNAKVELEIKNKREFAENHELSLITERYWKCARPLLKSIDLVSFGTKTIQEVELGITRVEAQRQLYKEVEMNLEILHFYIFFINIKSKRALSGIYEPMEHQEEFSDMSDDSLGSAKIALIATQRSMSSWALLMTNEIFSEEQTLPILALLDKTKNLIISLFPEVESFKRPGFDD